MIYTTIDNASQFYREFQRCNRGDQFSYEALVLLFDYFDDIGEDIELDVIAICCEYAEESAKDIARNYDLDFSDCDNETQLIEKVKEHLQDQGVFVGETSEGNLVYLTF